MNASRKVFRAGSRDSRLALIQSAEALGKIRGLLPGTAFELIPLSSPGDRDRCKDLRDSPADFFTRDLDEAVLAGRLDLAIHSAKDLPDPMPEGLDWCWLPWREDPRDALILAPGRRVDDLPSVPTLGVSSVRRAAWCRKRFPSAGHKPLRGNIEDRLAKLDAGEYDAVVMAGAALIRLGMADRVTEWLTLDELPVPPGQGVLAFTFRQGDPAMIALRNLFVKAVRFVGAGVGDAGLCTMAGAAELDAAEACLYDVLMDEHLLERLPRQAERIFVGKRAGHHSHSQDKINRLLANCVRRGLRTVRLKGGDPGIFGRLAEEIDELERLQLPYRILPGISSLTAATTGTGMLLTRRGISRGFTVITPRAAGGAVAPVTAAARAALPVVFFMAAKVADQVAVQLLEEGGGVDTPAAMVINAGADDEKIVHTTLGELSRKVESPDGDEAPSLLIVGEIARFTAKSDYGALAGRRVLLTCSAALQDKAVRLITDWGGRPIRYPLIRLQTRREAGTIVRAITEFAAVILTSPSAARCFIELLASERISHRHLPCLMVCGPGTAEELTRAGIPPDLMPAHDFGAAGMLQALTQYGIADRKILRLRSDRAGAGLAMALRDLGADVEDCVLYENIEVKHEFLPDFDVVFFASSSAVDVFTRHWSVRALDGKLTLAIGQPTAATLAGIGRAPDIIGCPATVQGALESLAAHLIRHGNGNSSITVY